MLTSAKQNVAKKRKEKEIKVKKILKKFIVDISVNKI